LGPTLSKAPSPFPTAMPPPGATTGADAAARAHPLLPPSSSLSVKWACARVAGWICIVQGELDAAVARMVSLFPVSALVPKGAGARTRMRARRSRCVGAQGCTPMHWPCSWCNVDSPLAGQARVPDGAASFAVLYGEQGGGSSSDTFRSTAELALGRVGGVCHRPRLLLCGRVGSGVGVVGEALLHHLEEIPIVTLDMASLIADPVSRCAWGRHLSVCMPWCWSVCMPWCCLCACPGAGLCACRGAACFFSLHYAGARVCFP
jgi:hypothetical protein